MLSAVNIMIRNKIYLIPNLLTMAAMLSGFLSIWSSYTGNLHSAAIFIIAAIIFDGLDGRIARITKTTSSFGAQLDSLSDIVSCGLAPAIFIFEWVLKYTNIFHNPWIAFGLIISFLYLASVALRLARFNSVASNDFFIGLPCPASAGIISISYIVASDLGIAAQLYSNIFLAAIIILSFLMVSKISYFSFKNISGNEKIKFYWLFSLVIVSAVALINPPIVFFILMLSYIVSGPFIDLSRFFKRLYSIKLTNEKSKDER